MSDKTPENTPDAGDKGKIDKTVRLPEPVVSQSVENSGTKESPTTLAKFKGNRYELQKELGDGAFGVVYRACDKSLERMVALKILKKIATVRDSASQQFLTEAQAMAAITNDHVMPVLDFGVEDGRAFISMPLLGGETLGSRVEREGAMSNSEIARIGREISSGLAAIHAKGFLHRDLKPNNIWLEAGSGRVKILDFGLAHDPLEDPQGLAGTPAYMSPEQANSQPLDARSDLFSLGSVLYFCATGRQPFPGTSVKNVLDSVQKNDPPSLLRLNPGLSPHLGELINLLMQKNPEQRPASARAVLEQLAEPSSPAKTAPMATTPVNRRWLLWAAAATGSAIALLALSSFLKPARPDPGNPPPQANVAPPVPGKLRVKSLEVYHFATVNADQTKPKGIIGKDSFAIHLDDEITVKATLNRPAYTYLIIFRPDGQAAVLYPQDPDDIPELTDTPAYPSQRLRERYFLEAKEKPGLWMVAAFASEKPLPSYNQWRKGLMSNPWRREPNPAKNLVAMYDGKMLESRNSPDRASKTTTDPTVNLVSVMMDYFTSQGADATSAVGFAVEQFKN